MCHIWMSHVTRTHGCSMWLIMLNRRDVQSLLHLHHFLAQSLPRHRSRRACVCVCVTCCGVGGKLHMCFVRRCRQVHNVCEVSLTLRSGYILVPILAAGCIYAFVSVIFSYLYCPISLLHACVSQVFAVFLNTYRCG